VSAGTKPLARHELATVIGPVLNAQTLLPLVIFLAVMALAISRPWGLNEAWPAVGAPRGALLPLGGLVPRDLIDEARETSGVPFFLLGMMVLSTVLEMAGVFAWAASYAARMNDCTSRVHGR
jgi:Na+/H+ antiporter NhaD/arsenite permease-like protein